ncbi:MAG: hypothetical protein ACFB0C_24275 [Leptolyngbyaceae cyanobacterium]
MTATVTQIFNGATDPSQIDQTATFSNADFLFFTAPNLPAGDGYEVAGALLVDVVGTQVIGGIPITTGYGQREIALPIEVFDTSLIVRIPFELSRSELNMQLCLATSYAIDLEVYAVSSTENSGISLRDILDAIDALNNLINAIQIISVLLPAVLTFLITGNPVPLIIGGTQLLLPSP